MTPTRYALVNAEGKTVLEGPKYLILDLALTFDTKYPGRYETREVY